MENFNIKEEPFSNTCIWVPNELVKQAKNHAKQFKNYQFCHTCLCKAILMSCCSKKFLLNDL
jgi:hypothetical protein